MSAVDDEPPLDERPDGGRQEPVLDLVDPSLERVPVVVVADRDRLLRDDRPVVDLLVDEVHGHAGDLHAPREGVGDRRRSGERRQQGRMDVQHPAVERADELGTDERA